MKTKVQFHLPTKQAFAMQRMQIKSGLLSVLLLLLTCYTSQAAIEKEIRSLNMSDVTLPVTTGNADKLVIWDAYFPVLIGKNGTSDLFDIKSSQINVVLRYESQDFLSDGYDYFTLTVEYDIELKNAQGEVVGREGETLQVVYTANGSFPVTPPSLPKKYIDKAMKSYKGQLSAKVTIVDVEWLAYNGGMTVATDISDKIYLDVEVETERYYKFVDPAATLTVGTDATAISTTKELEVNWNYMQGAESYDLEWLFYDLPAGAPLTGHEYDFRDATRINTTQQFYNISMAYPAGYLLYRVRPVGKGKVNGVWNDRIEGAWSVAATTGTLSSASGFYYQYTGLDTDKNWNYQINYAEEGKRKEVISYYDGTYRARQQSTLVNTNVNALIAETIYDRQGRPAINVLPFPMESKGVGFYTKSLGEPLVEDFDLDDFDTDERLDDEFELLGGTTISYLGPAPMGANDAANTYYSTSNTNTDEFNDFIPTAGGYPYTQTVYTNDGLNKVKVQSSPGEDYTSFNADHATRYIYTSTNQAELDRLFGNEAGLAIHYSKMYITDPNGQSTVQYLDNQDRVVASALAGQIPTDHLEAIDDKPTNDSIKADILLNNNTLQNNSTYAAHTFAVTAETPISLTFNYNLEGANHCDDCLPSGSNCTTCEYDLNIYMVDEEGRPVQYVPSGTTYVDVVIDRHFTSLANNSVSFTVDDMKKGVYTIYKTLTVYDTKIDQSTDTYYTYQMSKANDTDGGTPCNPWNPNRLATQPCEADCEDQCYLSYMLTDANGDNVFFDNSGNSYTPVFNTNNPPTVDHFLKDDGTTYSSVTSALGPHSLEYPQVVWDAIVACTTACGEFNPIKINLCELQLNRLKADMSPSGQYFDNELEKYERNADGTYVLDANGDRKVNASYDADDWLVNELGAATPYDVDVSFDIGWNWDSLRANWDDSYADILVTEHPEYCAYDYYCVANVSYENGTLTAALRNSYRDDMFAQDDDTYGETGTDYNFFNPIGRTKVSTPTYNSAYDYIEYQPYDVYNGSTILDHKMDPFMDMDPPTKGNIAQLFNDFIPANADRSSMSIWYVLDDPDGIATGTYTLPDDGGSPAISATIDATTEDLFVLLHGNGSTTGLIGSGSDQMSKFEFIRAVYDFYREYYIYVNLRDNYDCGTKEVLSVTPTTPYTGWSPDWDYDAYIDNAPYYGLTYPMNPIFQVYDPLNPDPGAMIDSMKPLAYDVICELNCKGFADDWMKEYADSCWAYYVSADTANMRADLIRVCQLGCVLDDGLIGNSLGKDSVTSGGTVDIDYVLSSDGNSQQLYNFEDVRDYYLTSSCTTTVEHPPFIAPNDLECNFSQLLKFVDEETSVSNPDTPTTADFTTIATVLTDSLTGTYSASDVESWYDYFTTGVGDISGTYPLDLTCLGCQCEQISGFFANTDYGNGSGGTDYSRIYEDAYGEIYYSGDTMPKFNKVLSLSNINAKCLSMNSWEPGNLTVPSPYEAPFFMSQVIDTDVIPDWLACHEGNIGPIDLEQAILDQCSTQQVILLNENLLGMYTQKAKKLRDRFKVAMYNSCLDSITHRESFTYAYELDEYAYTLYYYDQADNLVRTVPPRGVQDSILRDYSGGEQQLKQVTAYRAGEASSSYRVPGYEAYSTEYKYNSFNKVIRQITPDQGETVFQYDQNGRLILSQNSRQKDDGHVYSYTLYDELNRIIEVGEVTSCSVYVASTEPGANLYADYLTWLDKTCNSFTDITRTYYDVPARTYIAATFGPSGQQNLRNRVSSSMYFESMTHTEQAAGNHPDCDHGTHYSYDIHGNVKELVHENNYLGFLSPGNRFKRTKYEYDLVSGNVNKVHFQPGQYDQFIHRYCYDGDNRIVQVETSIDGKIWEKDAKYYYSPIGPLARAEIGHRQVHGMDYAYTLQGWLKAVNSGVLSQDHDMGADGKIVSTNLHANTARDALGYNLNYNNNDYTPVTSGTYITDVSDMGGGTTATRELFNGNISQHILSMIDQNENALQVHGKSYLYDQLNRLKSSRVYKDDTGADDVPTNNSFVTASTAGDAYKTLHEYDMDGNITELLRYPNTGTPMDNLTYHYEYVTSAYHQSATNKLTNRLNYISDASGTATYGDLSNNQSSANYAYDYLGNLINDVSEGLTITWNVYGKVKKITNSNGEEIEFKYDAAGNRVMKKLKPSTATNQNDWIYTHYARDAQGNVMATYEETFETVSGNKRRSNFTLAHHDIYGSKRLGTDNSGQALVTEFNASIHGTTGVYQHIDEVVYSELNKGELTQLMTAPEEEVVFIPYSGVDKTVRHIAGSENGITMSGTGITVTEGAYNISGSDIVVGAGEVIEFESTDTVRISNEGSSLILSSTENSEAGGRGGISKGKVNDLPFNTGTNAGGGTTWPYYNMVVVTEHERAADEKRYELTNHLGNVLLTLNDRKIAEGVASNFYYYTADVLSYADYYPFGMLMPDRNELSVDYRYGFNGMEKDDELKSIEGSSYDFGARMYDPRVGRWFSVDPARRAYPFLAPQSAFAGNPIFFIDSEGKTLEIGGNINASLEDIRSLVPEEYRSQIKVNDDGLIIFENYDKLPNEVKEYEGVKLVNNLINSAKRYKYSASERAEAVNRKTGEKYVIVTPEGEIKANQAISNLSTTPRSDLSEEDLGNSLPEGGFDGSVTIDEGEFFRINPRTKTGEFKYDRSKVVFHELEENYLRTDVGLDYGGNNGAHIQSSKKANKFSKELTGKKDIFGGEVSGFKKSEKLNDSIEKPKN